jgi:hypothetical protein
MARRRDFIIKSKPQEHTRMTESTIVVSLGSQDLRVGFAGTFTQCAECVGNVRVCVSVFKG